MPKSTTLTQTKLSDRKFHKTIFRYEVLSEEPLGEVSLEDLQALCSDGPCSGRFLKRSETVLNGRQAVLALLNQGSDHEFFNLTERGEDAKDLVIISASTPGPI